MKRLSRCFVFGCLLVISKFGPAQQQGVPTSLIQLIANPERFDGKLVVVHGFLRIGHEKHHGTETVLYLHQEDATHLLGSNAVWVIASEQMIRDHEKIDGMYVMLTGVVRAVSGAGGSSGMVIKDVQSCRAWSDPRRPIGLKDDIQSTDKK